MQKVIVAALVVFLICKVNSLPISDMNRMGINEFAIGLRVLDVVIDHFMDQYLSVYKALCQVVKDVNELSRHSPGTVNLGAQLLAEQNVIDICTWMADHTYSNITLDCNPNIAMHSVLKQCQEVMFISDLSSSIKLILQSTSDYYNEVDVSNMAETAFVQTIAQQIDDDAIRDVLLAPYH